MWKNIKIYLRCIYIYLYICSMLPYQGNKSAIAQDLVLFLRQSFDYNNFYDLFGGGGSISIEVLAWNKKGKINKTTLF